MPKKLFKPPKEVVQEWPEVFDDLYMSSMPVEYIYCVEIQFSDGRVWEIDIEEQLELQDSEDVMAKLVDAFREYKNEIQNINFRVDIERLKNDVINSTKGILNNK